MVIETTKLASGFSVADLFPSIEGLLQWISGIRPQLEKMHQESDIILENIISEHKKARATLDLGDMHEKNNEDLVDVLLKVQELEDSEFHLTANNIKAVIWEEEHKNRAEKLKEEVKLMLPNQWRFYLS
ncbi:hypothetical protein LWI28_012855 [Acer negundo]|uniref:Uncharacterized protein n=1 Tax=Acer negundo TaxID=4023 RepID=A0AAD5J4G1_ACENE|nr:hypothetical protein LWI28_012855 [Acer negundo]